MRWGNRGRVGCAVFAAVLTSAFVLPAWATNVVDVRVGRHVAFTRVVFELDSPAGYRIERSEPGPGISELVVSLNAGSGEKSLTTKNSLIDGVTMEPRGPNAAVARIRLSKDGLRLKEMILASPPRIVLDILSDKPVPVTTAKATPKAKPAPKSQPAPVPDTAQAEAAAKARREAEVRADAARAEARRAAAAAKSASGGADSAAASARKAPEPAPAKPNGTTASDTTVIEIPSAAIESAKGAAPAKTTAVVPGESGSAEAAAREQARRDAAASALAEAMGGDVVEQDEAIADAIADEDAAQQLAMVTPDKRAGALDPTPAAARRPASPPARQSQSSEEGGIGMTAIAAVAGAVVLAGGFVWMRRRRANGFDESAEYEGENPFTGLDSGEEEKTLTEGFAVAAESGGSAEGIGDESGPVSFEVPPADPISAQPTAPETDQGDLFAAGAEAEAQPTEGATMDSASSDFETTLISDHPAPAIGGAGLGDEVTALIRELERRVVSLETRLDEVVDSKERLERQVVAQTEELRVQRAAIARTQRAVRNMARPEDESSATEPALRNPETPA